MVTEVAERGTRGRPPGADGDGEDRRPRGGTSPWEWVVGALGALLVAATVSFMAYEALARERTPPDLVIQVDSVSRTTGGWRVEIIARNRGTTTAARVLVEGRLRGGGEPETAEVTIDYVPGRGERAAGMIFTRDPRAGSLELRARSYDLP